MQYKIMKQLKLPLEFKAYYFGSALNEAGKSHDFELAVRTFKFFLGRPVSRKAGKIKSNKK